ncbi:jg15141 [Pararge aegeria aegeria]|uniref:Jg15141 protein n=1 Tax=Pararge aegeria aegeria TaxID=348720 RepID=A0A8S4S2M7_9NEOP|nr:jg15141 [Pararge aegeria aegeria]
MAPIMDSGANAHILGMNLILEVLSSERRVIIKIILYKTNKDIRDLEMFMKVILNYPPFANNMCISALSQESGVLSANDASSAGSSSDCAAVYMDPASTSEYG